MRLYYDNNHLLINDLFVMKLLIIILHILLIFLIKIIQIMKEKRFDLLYHTLLAVSISFTSIDYNTKESNNVKKQQCLFSKCLSVKEKQDEIKYSADRILCDKRHGPASSPTCLLVGHLRVTCASSRR